MNSDLCESFMSTARERDLFPAAVAQKKARVRAQLGEQLLGVLEKEDKPVSIMVIWSTKDMDGYSIEGAQIETLTVSIWR